jgi:SNF2 family DNA or RNA helicase
MQLVEQGIEGGHKMLIFSQFTSMLQLIGTALVEKGIKYHILTGETPVKERPGLVEAFQEDDTPVFLISLKAGGTGLNLTAADIVIHYDPWWNVAAQNQATDRSHRIGQENTVNVYKLIVKDTIEDKILQLQEAKKQLADDILSGEQTSIASLGKEELLELLQ